MLSSAGSLPRVPEMTLKLGDGRAVVAAALLLASTLMPASIAAELPKASRVPPTERFTYVEDGDFSRELRVPTYEYIPVGVAPKAIILAIHGLTLHGQTFAVLGKAFAANGYYFLSTDMRGFGRCYTDTAGKFCSDGDCRKTVDYERAVEDLAALARKAREKYPNIPLGAMGESLGCTIAIHLAAEHPELVDGLLLSAPAVRVNPAMILTPANIVAGFAGVFIHPRLGISMTTFFKKLVSNDPDVIRDSLADPLIRKHMRVGELLKSDGEVAKTNRLATRLKEGTPLLVVQGSEDKCVVPRAVSRLTKHVNSTDQTIRWFSQYGHLLFETPHLRAATLEALASWVHDHQPEERLRLKDVESEIEALGGTVKQ